MKKHFISIALALLPALCIGQVIPADFQSDYIVLVNGDTLHDITITEQNKKLIYYLTPGGAQAARPLSEVKHVHDSDLADVPFVYVDGRITYTAVVPMENKSAAELYTAARGWYTKYFKNSSAVLQLQDAKAGLLQGRGWMPVLLGTVGSMAIDGKMWVDIRIEVKDNRYRYTLTNIEIESSPLEEYDSVAIDKAITKKFQRQTKLSVFVEIEAIILSIAIQMQKPPAPADDW